MPFIRTVPPDQAEGPAAEMYRRVRERQGFIANHVQAFSLRPGVRDGWLALNASITANLPVRTYELVTLAAARALRSSYCSLAHGKVLADKVFDAEGVEAIATGRPDSLITEGERAMMAFAEKVVRSADGITAADVDELRRHGCADEVIFDIAAAAAARCFFSKLLDALGVQADARYNELAPGLLQALTVGRPVAQA
jgi:uncharacterized peroxidase-related enzyme